MPETERSWDRRRKSMDSRRLSEINRRYKGSLQLQGLEKIHIISDWYNDMREG